MQRYVYTLSLIAFALAGAVAQDAKDTEKAAATRKALMSKISVDYKDTLMQDVVTDLADQMKTATSMKVATKLDVTSGVSQNTKVTHEAKNKTVAEVLDEIGKKYDIGYVVVSGTYKSPTKTFGKEFDGTIIIKKGSERGYPEKSK